MCQPGHISPKIRHLTPNITILICFIKLLPKITLLTLYYSKAEVRYDGKEGSWVLSVGVHWHKVRIPRFSKIPLYIFF